MSLPKVVIILGPTASGKTALSIRLARKFDGEVISADSRQVYKGLDIGTGKVTKREMQGVPHYMLSIVSPKKAFTAAQFAQKARRIAADIIKRGKMPIVCGGTGFYIDAFLGKIVLPQVPPNPLLRKSLEKTTVAEMFARLQKQDPIRAAAIDSNNPRRLIRALEIAEALGTSPVATDDLLYEPLWIGLSWPQTSLDKRIKSRLLARMRSGMLKEAQRLRKSGLSFKRMEELGLEYRAMARHLKGEVTRVQMTEELFRDIRRYSKKQILYWNRNKDIEWFRGQSAKASHTSVQRFISRT